MDITRPQETAIIPNEAEWYMLVGIIMVMAALLSYGVGQNFARWGERAELGKKFTIVGELVGILLASLQGLLLGYLVWHWALGLVFGHVGGWASPWIMNVVGKWIDKKRGGQSAIG
jgi:hypothetical protein